MKIVFCPICGKLQERKSFDINDNFDRICDTEDCMGEVYVATSEEIDQGYLS